MIAELNLQKREGSSWWRGLAPMLRHENRKWWHGRRWVIQMILWILVLDGLLLMALYVLPPIASADGVPITHAEALDIGRQIFFGLGALGLGIGAIVLLQDAFIEEKATGTAAWVLSKPVSRTAFYLSKLLPILPVMALFMFVIPGILGYLIFWIYDPAAVPLSGFLVAEGITAINLLFYVTLTLLLGVLVSNRGLLLGIAMGSLLGGGLIPIPAVLQFTPWKLGEFTLLPVTGQPVPPIGITMLISTVVWCLIFVAIAIWRLNRLEF